MENIKSAVDAGKLPSEAFSELEREAQKVSKDPLTHALNAPRDVKQMRNAKQRVKEKKELPADSLYTAYQLGHVETDFITDFILLPSLIILLLNKGNSLLID